MNPHSRKLIEIPQDRFTIYAYCGNCATQHKIDTREYADFTFNDIHEKMVCSNCGNRGMSFSIKPKK